MSNNTKKAIFLDRDGTINPDTGYMNDSDSFNLYPFSAEAIRLLNRHDYLVFIVTNQSGVARGLIELPNLAKIHAKLEYLLSEQNAHIDKIYTAPYHKNGIVEPYNTDHQDRKPQLGMFRKALQEYPIDTKNSFMVGDRYSDILFGVNAGMKTILVKTGDGNAEIKMQLGSPKKSPDFIVRDLLSAAKFIVGFQE